MLYKVFETAVKQARFADRALDCTPPRPTHQQSSREREGHGIQLRYFVGAPPALVAFESDAIWRGNRSRISVWCVCVCVISCVIVPLDIENLMEHDSSSAFKDGQDSRPRAVICQAVRRPAATARLLLPLFLSSLARSAWPGSDLHPSYPPCPAPPCIAVANNYTAQHCAHNRTTDHSPEESDASSRIPPINQPALESQEKGERWGAARLCARSPGGDGVLVMLTRPRQLPRSIWVPHSWVNNPTTHSTNHWKPRKCSLARCVCETYFIYISSYMRPEWITTAAIRP